MTTMEQKIKNAWNVVECYLQYGDKHKATQLLCEFYVTYNDFGQIIYNKEKDIMLIRSRYNNPPPFAKKFFLKTKTKFTHIRIIQPMKWKYEIVHQSLSMFITRSFVDIIFRMQLKKIYFIKNEYKHQVERMNNWVGYIRDWILSQEKPELQDIWFRLAGALSESTRATTLDDARERVMHMIQKMEGVLEGRKLPKPSTTDQLRYYTHYRWPRKIPTTFDHIPVTIGCYIHRDHLTDMKIEDPKVTVFYIKNKQMRNDDGEAASQTRNRG